MRISFALSTGLGLVVASAVAAAQPVDYSGDKLIRVQVEAHADLEALEAIGADQWTHRAKQGPVDFIVPAESMDEFLAIGLEHAILIDDIEPVLRAERERLAGVAAGARGGDWYADFKPYEQIDERVDQLVGDHDQLATRVSVGTTLEGREIFAMRITAPGGEAKPAFLINSLQHAREWVTVMSTMYLAQTLLEGYGVDSGITDLLESYEFIIIPVVNADGYVFSWTDERLWRKTRRDNGDGTFGVDPNRNWSFEWGHDDGSSPNTNSQTYRGPEPFSEACTSAVRDFILANPQIVLHVDVHSYSQLILAPFGYGPDEAPDHCLFEDVGPQIAEAIESVHGTVYTPQRGVDLYPASGIMPDWTYGDRDVFAWTFELRPLTGAQGGFVLPPEQILPTAEEVFAGLTWIADWFDQNEVWIGLPDGVPSSVAPETSTQITVKMNRAFEDPASGSVLCYTRTAGSESYDVASAVQVDATTYVVTLPGAACGEVIEFYVEAQSISGEIVTNPPGGPDAPIEVPVIDVVVIASDDLEIDSGWTVGAADDDAIRGIWERVDPNGTSAQPEDDHTVSGTNCFVTGQHTGGGAGSSDVDGGRTTLLSPVLDLSLLEDPSISYWRWFSNHAGANPAQDVFVVEISGDGTSWTTVEQVGPEGPESSGGWYSHELRVAEFVTPTETVQLRFVAQDQNGGSLVEAAVDDVVVHDTVACETLCPCDWDGSGLVNSLDFFAFLENFAAGDADFDGSGSTNSQDLFGFLACFSDGC